MGLQLGGLPELVPPGSPGSLSANLFSSQALPESGPRGSGWSKPELRKARLGHAICLPRVTLPWGKLPQPTEQLSLPLWVSLTSPAGLPPAFGPGLTSRIECQRDLGGQREGDGCSPRLGRAPWGLPTGTVSPGPDRPCLLTQHHVSDCSLSCAAQG